MHHLLPAIQQRRRIRAQPLQHLFDQALLLKLWNQRRVFEADPAKQRGDSDCDECVTKYCAGMTPWCQVRARPLAQSRSLTLTGEGAVHQDAGI